MEIHEDLARGILEKAREKGATDGDVLIVEGEHFNGRVRLSQVEQITEARERHLGLRLDRLVEDTCDLSRATAYDEYAGLPEMSLRGAPPALELFDPMVHRLSVKEKLDLATRAEAAAFAADPRITNSEGAEFSSRHSKIVYAHTGGFSGSYQSSSFVLSVSPIAGQNDTMQRDHWYSMSRMFDRLDSPESVGRTAAQRTVRRIGARKVSTCQVPVVFDPETASTLLHNLFTVVSGYSLYKGASFLGGRLGERIAPESLTVIDDGTLPGGLGSKPFDGEGVPTQKTVVVDQGILTHYLTDSYSGRKLKLPSTGNAGRGIGDPPSVSPTNFYLAPGP
ncbi:MAG: TldD/PmbA family protein, partial [Nitrospirae bacterium]|nr:TldD/PmbA family protein [Nitrospirota bacterium]